MFKLFSIATTTLAAIVAGWFAIFGLGYLLFWLHITYGEIASCVMVTTLVAWVFITYSRWQDWVAEQEEEKEWWEGYPERIGRPDFDDDEESEDPRFDRIN